MPTENEIEKYLKRSGLEYDSEDGDTYVVDISDTLFEDISSALKRYALVVDCGRYCIVSKSGNQITEQIKKNNLRLVGMLPVDLTEEIGMEEPEIGNKSNGDKGAKEKESIQSEEMFKHFAKAIDVLGKELGIGPLQNKLKENGITWSMNGDKSAIIFYVETQGGKKQPVIKIPASNLMTQNDFQQHLLNVLDFARGNAPGTFKQRKEELTKQENIVRDIARSVFPSDTSSKIASLMR